MSAHVLLYFRAFSPYHQGPILGPIPNPKFPPFFPMLKKKFQSEGKNKSHRVRSINSPTIALCAGL